MARAHLLALACAGLLIGAHDHVGTAVAHTELAPVLSCWDDATSDLQRRLDLVRSLHGRVGDPTLFRHVSAPQARPAWHSCLR